ncbi:MAG: outer membrane protein transport protein [Nitrospirae bacterium]|nr:outer membrane protein transport protein [Nitrospirota bacterium]
MKRLLSSVLVALCILSFAGISAATNGDNLIGIGPISRSMGGVGIAAPQDAISAVFSNPAAMCFGPFCPGSGFDFAGTIFMPTTHTRITIPAFGLDTGRQRSDSDLYLIPAIGISSPISQDLRFGLAAYGVSGLGVDYREKMDLDPGTPGNQSVYTNLMIMKFAPNLAYMVNPNFSVGGAIHINYAALDLAEGQAPGYSAGVQLGAIYKSGPLSLGATYVSQQKAKHKKVANFDAAFGDLQMDDLKLGSPQYFGLGAAFEPVRNVLLVEANAKWLNWADAAGYEDFGWKNQWVFNIGAQYKPTPQVSLRAGFNYGRNPVRNNVLSGSTPPVSVQGKSVPQFQYEILRLSGFPAIVESHITAGLGYQLTKSVSIDLGLVYAFKKSMKETGTAAFPDGSGGFVVVPVSIESDLQETALDFGITWKF